MENLGFTEAEFALLQRSEDESNALVRIEERAMHAVEGLYEDAAGRFTVEGEPDPALARELMFSDDHRNEKENIMRPIAEMERLLEDRTARRVADLQRRNGMIQIIVLIVAVLAIGLMILNYRIIAKRLVSRHHNVGKKQDQDVFGDLIGGMRELASVVADVQKATENVSSGSHQLSSVAQQLSQGASQQAASAEEVSSSMEEMGANIRQTSDNALEMEKISHNAARNAEEGGSAVTPTVQAMRKIADGRDSSKRCRSPLDHYRKVSVPLPSVERPGDTCRDKSMKPPLSDRCELCHREKELTFHHLIPKKAHRKRRIRYRFRREELHNRGLWVCRLCHRQLHRFFSEEHLADQLNTRERILEEPGMIRFLAWARRQK